MGMPFGSTAYASMQRRATEAGTSSRAPDPVGQLDRPRRRSARPGAPIRPPPPLCLAHAPPPQLECPLHLSRVSRLQSLPLLRDPEWLTNDPAQPPLPGRERDGVSTRTGCPLLVLTSAWLPLLRDSSLADTDSGRRPIGR
jgi:hypothetical protein